MSQRTEIAAGFSRSPFTPVRLRQLCYVAGCVCFGLRGLLWYMSEGTNDIRTWLRFAQEVQRFGLGGTYRLDLLFNHPPLMGLLARDTWNAAQKHGWSFAHVFKLYGLFAELGTALLLTHIWRRRGRHDRAAYAFAGYSCGLCGVLISGYHGNTDPVYWLLVLGGVYMLQDGRAPFLAGLLIAASLQVKLIPMLVVLPLAACCRDLKAFVRYCAGAALGLVPYAILLLNLSPVDRAAFARNVLGYTSYREYWGLEIIVKAVVTSTLTSAPWIAVKVEAIGVLWAELGSKILLLVTTLLACAHGIRRYPGIDGYAMGSLCFGLFLVLASGFGVQYMGAVVPLLFACRMRDGLLFATFSGVFIGLIYVSFVKSWTPIFSQHTYFSPTFAVPSFVVWWLILRTTVRIWRTRDWPAPLQR